ncbi:MAG: hypothetical protein JST75_17145 [Bacteroidetes bacterium]|nr:hypothetical protein [Bacteroidota bacterium]
MPRVKSFDAPHKGLRNIIGQFSLLIGQTDFSDAAELEKLKSLGAEMFMLLNNHVHTENEHTLRNLEAKAKGASAHDVADHIRLEVIQHSLEKRLTAFSGNESYDDVHHFYLDFSMFHSEYLEHIFEEETVTELLLQENFTDEELVQQRVAIMGTMDFPVLLSWIKYIIPAQREEESVAMLSGFKANAPAPAFDAVLNTIKGAMEPQRYQNLVSKL